MAYLNFSEAPPASAPRTSAASAAATASGFSPLEWLVIALARKDHPGSLHQPGRLSRALRSLFGLGTRSQLADPRLERLRRTAVLVWHRGWNLPESEIAAFLSEFTTAQFETLLAAIGVEKSGARRRIAA